MNTYHPFVAVSQLPVALRVPRKKTRPWSCVTRILSMLWLSLIWGPRFFFMAIWSSNYASKTRTAIVSKKTCCIVPNHFPKSDVLCNSLKYRALARMSTWTLLYLALVELESRRLRRTVLFWHRFVFTLKPVVFWGVAYVVCFMCLNINVFKHLNVRLGQSRWDEDHGLYQSGAMWHGQMQGPLRIWFFV